MQTYLKETKCRQMPKWHFVKKNRQIKLVILVVHVVSSGVMLFYDLVKSTSLISRQKIMEIMEGFGVPSEKLLVSKLTNFLAKSSPKCSHIGR